MRRIALLFPLIFLLVGCPVPAVASVTVSGSNVQDVTGVPLFTGQWCFGATCLTVTNGSFSGSITAGTQTVTVVNGSSVTILSVSDVTIGANYNNWNNYTVPYGVTFTGNGAPYLACQMSALYTQLDVSPNPTFLCVAQGGQLVWKLQGPATPAGPGITSGLGVPTLPAVVPTIYVRTDVAEQYSLSGLSGSVSSTWTKISGGSGSMTWPGGTASGIAAYSYPNAWGSVYNGANQIPASFVNLSAYALLDSPALTGTPTAPTQGTCASNTDIATGAYVANCASGSSGPATYYNVLSYGAKADEVTQISGSYIAASMTSGSHTLSVPSGIFTSADANKYVLVWGWNNQPFSSTPSVAKITAAGAATSVTLSIAAANNWSGYIYYGTDNVPAFNSCAAAAKSLTGGGTCFEPAGSYLLATTPYYVLTGAHDDGGYETPAGGTVPTLIPTMSGGSIASVAVSGGSNLAHSATLQTTIGGGCPIAYDVGACGQAWVTYQTNSSGVPTTATVVYGGFGFTGTPTITAQPLGGDGATATATLSGSTMNTPTLTAGGAGYAPSSSVPWYALAGTSGCAGWQNWGGTQIVAAGSIATNSSGVAAGTMSVSHNATGCTSAPTIIFGNVACNTGTAGSPIWGQCSNIAPVPPVKVPVQVMMADGVAFEGDGTPGGGTSINSVWDGISVDNNEPAIFGGTMEYGGLKNLNFGSGFIGVLATNNVNYESWDGLGFNTAIGIYTTATDVGFTANNLSFGGYASWINGGTWTHRVDDPEGNGGFFDGYSVTNLTVRPPAYGGPGSVSQKLDDWFNETFWRAEWSGASTDFWETCKYPQTLAQRQTSHTFFEAQQANEQCYRGISSVGLAIIPRDGRQTGSATLSNLIVKEGSRYLFYGDLGGITATNMSGEDMLPISGNNDPYRAATTQEGAIVFNGGNSSSGATQATLNGVYWTNRSGYPNLSECLWSLQGDSTTAGTPVNTIWSNSACQASYVNTGQPRQNPSYQSLIPFAHGAEFASDTSNGVSGFFLVDAWYGNANHQTACVMGEYGGLKIMDPSCTTQYLGVTGGGIASSVNLTAPGFTDTGLVSQACVGTDSSGNFEAGTCTPAPTVVQTNQPAIYGAHLQDFTSAAILMPTAAGFVSTANGSIGYDLTGLNWHGWVNGTDMLLGFLPTTGITNGHCANFAISGTTITFGDAGGACTTGGSMVWPSTPGIAYWTTGTSWGGAYNSSTPIPANYLPAALSSSNSVNGTSIPSSVTLAYLGATAQTFTNGLTAPTVTSNVATGTAPFSVTSTTAVANLSIGGTAAKATSIAGGILNDIPYQTAANTTSFVAPVNSAVLVTNGSGVPSESTSLPSGLTIPGYASSSASTAVNGQVCALGSSCTIPIQTNGTINTSEAGINLIPSTVNSVGLTVTPTNPATNQETFEITGSYTGNAATATSAGKATNLAGTNVYSAPYQSGSATTGYTTAPAVNGQYVYGWTVAGSAAVAPTALNLGTYLASPPAIGGTAPNTGSFTVLNNIYNAADYSGADCGAKINAADTALGATAGDIDVNQACGTTWTTPVVLSSNHNLVFIQRGTYTVPAPGIEFKGSYNIVDLRGAELQLTASQTGKAGMFQTYNSTNVGSYIWVENGILDGNMSNESSANTCLYAACNPALLIDNNNVSTAAAHDIHFENNIVQNWNNPAVVLGSTSGHYPLPRDIWIDGHNQFLNLGAHGIFSFGFDRNFFIRDNIFAGWGVGLTTSHANPITTFDFTTYSGTSQFNLDVSRNVFRATQTQYDGFGFAGELGAGGAGWITNFTWNGNQMLDGGTGDGPALSGIFSNAAITGNTSTSWGFPEVTGANITISGNSVTNGQISLNPGNGLYSSGNTISGNTVTIANDYGPSSNPQGPVAISIAGGGVKTITLTKAIRQTAQTFNVATDALVFTPQTTSGTPPLITITGTFSGGASHGFQNWAFTLGGATTSTDGATNLGNNGTFICYDSTGTTMSFVNPLGVSETLPTGAQLSSSASTTAYIGTFFNSGSALYYGGFNGWAGQPNIVVSGFTTTANNGTFTAIANSKTVLAVTNASGANETHSASMVLAPAMANSVVGHNDVSFLSIANAGCVGIQVGLSDGSYVTITNLLIDGNTITAVGANSSCSGMFLIPGATASGFPASSGLDIKNNFITGTYYGIRGDLVTTANPVNDITIEGNKILSSAYEQISFPTPPSIFRKWDNVTSATQTTEALNGGATMDASGDISSPGWVSGGVFTPYPASGAVTWSSAAAVNVITLGGNVTSSTIANGAFAGQQVCFAITQGSSVYSIVWPTNMQGMSQPSQSAYYSTYQCAVYVAAGSIWQALAPMIDGLGSMYLPGTVNATQFYDRGAISASLLGTDSSGKLQAVTGSAALPGTLTLGSGTSDSATITGVTSSSHCVAFPTNTTATGASILLYFSGASTGTATFTHAATVGNGATYSVLCTAN